MKIILTIVALLGGSYLLMNWAGDNPRDARKITREVDNTAAGLVDKGKRAAAEIKK